jgi:hypothetical protein
MSFATTIGHTFTGVVHHHSRVPLPQRPTASPVTAPTPTPEGHRHVHPVIDPAVDDHRQELEQWRGAFALAIGLNR